MLAILSGILAVVAAGALVGVSQFATLSVESSFVAFGFFALIFTAALLLVASFGRVPPGDD